MKKQIHFFGCSFTAGDELIDEELFPWKKDPDVDFHEYYKRRNEYLIEAEKQEEYQLKNKTLAYPAILNNDNYQTYNHAANGAGFRTNIYKILNIIYTQPVDIIFLQIPPVGRELYVHDDGFVNSLSLAFEPHLPKLKDYVKAKNISHKLLQSSLDDLMDLIMISNLAKQKNIKLVVIDLFFELVKRSQDLANFENFEFICTNYIKEIEQLDLIRIVSRIKQFQMISKGGHFTRTAHQEIADHIQAYLENNLKPQA